MNFGFHRFDFALTHFGIYSRDRLSCQLGFSLPEQNLFFRLDQLILFWGFYFLSNDLRYCRELFISILPPCRIFSRTYSYCYVIWGLKVCSFRQNFLESSILFETDHFYNNSGTFKSLNSHFDLQKPFHDLKIKKVIYSVVIWKLRNSNKAVKVKKYEQF